MEIQEANPGTSSQVGNRKQGMWAGVSGQARDGMDVADADVADADVADAAACLHFSSSK